MKKQKIELQVETKADNKAIKSTERGLKKVNKALESGDFDEAARAADKLSGKLEKMQGVNEGLRTSLLDVSRAQKVMATSSSTATNAVDKMDASNKQVTKSSKNTGYAVLEASRAVEDMQYGIRGAINNVPQLVQHLGGAAGLAGVISLVAVGASILIPKLGKMIDVIAGLDSETVKLAKTEARLEIAQRRRAAAEEKQASKRKRHMDSYKQDLEIQLELSRALFIDAKERIEQLDREFQQHQKIKQIQHQIALSKVENDDSLTEPERKDKINRINESFNIEQKEDEIDHIEAQNDKRRGEIERLEARYDKERSESLDKLLTKQKELERLESVLLEAQNLRSKINPNIIKTVEANDSLELSGFLKRKDTKSHAEFAEQFARDEEKAKRAAKSQLIVGNDVLQVEALAAAGRASIGANEAVKNLENEIKDLKRKIGELEKKRETNASEHLERMEELHEDFEQGVKRQDELSFSAASESIKDAKRVLDESRKNASDTLSKQIQELKETANEDQLKAAKDEFQALNKVVEDGKISADEVGAVGKSLRDLLQTFSGGTQDQYEKINGILKASIQNQERITQAIDALNRRQSEAESRMNATLQRIEGNGNL